MSLEQIKYYIEEDILQQKIYDEVFRVAMELILEHENKPEINQLVSSSLLAIAVRFYKTALTPEDFDKFLNSLAELSKNAKPFGVADILPKNKLN
jgi:hypothetical protein